MSDMISIWEKDMSRKQIPFRLDMQDSMVPYECFNEKTGEVDRYIAVTLCIMLPTPRMAREFNTHVPSYRKGWFHPDLLEPSEHGGFRLKPEHYMKVLETTFNQKVNISKPSPTTSPGR